MQSITNLKSMFIMLFVMSLALTAMLIYNSGERSSTTTSNQHSTTTTMTTTTATTAGWGLSKDKPLLFIFATTEWGEPSPKAGNFTCGHNTTVLEMSNDMSRLSESNGLFYFASDLPKDNSNWKITLPHPDTMVTVMYGLETPPHYFGWCYRVPGCIEYFNWTIGYAAPYSDITETYFRFDVYDEFYNNELKSPFNFDTLMALKEPGKVGSWFNSYCVEISDVHSTAESERLKFMRRVMERMHVDSYGDCLHNIDLPPEGNRQNPGNGRVKSEIISHYKFYFALENSNCPYYITEKAVQSLLHGVVPVFMGHETTLQFMPPGSYVYVNDFNTTKQLVDHLNYLDKNDAEYHKFFKWREDIEIVKKWGELFKHNDAMCDLYRLYNKFIQNYDSYPRKHAIVDPGRNQCEDPYSL
ncbi:hypothetical protein SAMD00019534_122480, partial [Acytostelium subglobosum LB1]|uniref:hypothetical protein n=1 Tax=Acytostelium subglobosum LB1 TaxID=1410327 RepID=UPI000644FC7E